MPRKPVYRKPNPKAPARPRAQKKRPTRVIRGKGGYISDYLGEKIGGFLGGYRPGSEEKGKKIANALGGMGGSLAKMILGSGAYAVKNNSIVSSGQVPFMHSANDGVRIRHREYITDVISSIGFNNVSYSVNPALATTFPWLAPQASQYEEYRIDGMAVEYVPTCGDALSSTNNALGAVILTAEYNTLNAPFANKQQMENSMWAVSAKPSQNQCMFIECAQSHNPMGILYTRSGSVPTNSDQRLYDLCNIQVATVGMQASGIPIGELWITYDVVLMKPQISVSGSGEGNGTLHFHDSTSGDADSASPFGTSVGRVIDFTDILSFGVNDDGFSWNAGVSGTFQLQYYCIGTSATSSIPTFTLVNATRNNIYKQTSAYDSTSGQTGTVFFYSICFTITNPALAGSLVISGGTYPSTLTTVDVFVNKCSSIIE